VGFGPYDGVMTEGGDVFQYVVSVPFSGRAGEDSVLERLGLDFAAWTGEVEVFVGPGRVGGQVAFGRSHLVDSPCHEFPQAHEGMGCDGGGVVVVRRCGVIFGPVLEKHVPSSGP